MQLSRLGKVQVRSLGWIFGSGFLLGKKKGEEERRHPGQTAVGLTICGVSQKLLRIIRGEERH